MVTIGVLAVQGAFIEHEKVLEHLGACFFEIRNLKDLERPFDGLILPGGESTVQGKLLHELGLFEPLKDKIEKGLPVLATCAGMILLARQIAEEQTTHFGTLPIVVRRNAYGRQLGSFHTVQAFEGQPQIPMTFIRAPYVEKVAPEVKVLATVKEHIVAVRYNNQIALSFHPELDIQSSCYIHQQFIKLCTKEA